jgi:hypothetical protein
MAADNVQQLQVVLFFELVQKFRETARSSVVSLVDSFKVSTALSAKN